MKRQHLLPFLIFLLLSFSSLSLRLWGQDFLWTAIAGMGELQAVEEGEKELYLLSEGGLFMYPDKGKMETLHPLGYSEGLNHHGISKICYLAEQKTLFVYYTSGAFDLISPEGTLSNTAIQDNLSLQNRELARILYHDGKLYLAGDFGLSRINIETATIEATYFIMQPLQDVARIGQKIYVLDQRGKLFEGDESNNLQDPSLWTPLTFPQLGSVTLSAVASLGDQLLLLTKEEGRLFRYDPRSKETLATEEQIEALFVTAQGILAKGSNRLIFYAHSGATQSYPMDTWGFHDVSFSQMGSLLYATKGKKVILFKEGGEIEEKEVLYNGPSTNSFFDATLSRGSFFSVAGGRSTDRSWIKGSIAIRDKGGDWHNVSRENIPESLRHHFFDLVSIAVDPRDPNHFFAGGWGEGLYEFRNLELVERYTLHNSPLQSALPQREDADRYVRVSSLAFDSKGNLWMTQGSTAQNIWMLSTEGEWYSFVFPEIAKVNSFDHFLILPSGTKWLNMAHRGLSGVHALFVFNDHYTPQDPSDDQSYYFTQFSDRTGKNIEAKRYYDLVIDKKGVLWIGSDKGPLLIADPEAPIREGRTPIATRPVGGVEPNLFYVLDNIPVSTIAVDAVNNKWVGTLGDGIYLLSADGTSILEHYTQANSPLISNEIVSLLLDEDSGLLFISTEKGLMTYNSGSRSFEKEMKKEIHAYPNPLRPEDPDEITFTGLIAGMEIKILDAAGNLVESAFSSGATYHFTPRNSDGKRLPAGIYMALFYDPSSKMSHSIRFAIVQ